jgi:tripartite-type tricarboxylate transporter receptor subunit TctC
MRQAMIIINQILRLLISTLLVVCSVSSQAQVYPSQPIKLVVHTGPASATDILARRTATSLGPLLGRAVVVDNKPGGSGAIAASFVARAQADGYTLFFGTTQTQAVNPHLIDALSYDPLKDFVPVARLYSVNMILVVRASMPVNTIEELLKWLKENPEKANFGSTGFGTSSHLPAAYLSNLTGIKITHIPYNNPGQLMTDVTSGQVAMLFYPPEGVKSFIDSGALKPLAWTGEKRSAIFPQTPTMLERNFKDFTFGAWFGVFAPAGTQPAIVAKLSELLGKVVLEPTLIQSVLAGGAQMNYAPAAEFNPFTKTEYERMRYITSQVGKKD